MTVCVFILLINIKMPTFFGISIFMSRINFMLICVECEKSFNTLGRGGGEFYAICMTVISLFADCQKQDLNNSSKCIY